MTILRIMSFNIRCHAWLPQYDEGVNAWPNRSTLNVAVIKRQDPDLIGFQELERPSHLATYDTTLAGYDRFVGPVYGTKELACYVSIFWKRERLELLGAGGFWLSETPAVYSRGWDGACARSAAWVRLRDLQTGLEFLHLNTHLDHVGEQARDAGTNAILAQLGHLAADTPAVVTGDFNCKPPSAVYTRFEDAGFTDTFVAAGNTDIETFTYHGYKGTDPDKTWRIDWIMVRNLPRQVAIRSCRIVRDAEPPLYPSDHFPVVAELGVTAAP